MVNVSFLSGLIWANYPWQLQCISWSKVWKRKMERIDVDRMLVQPCDGMGVKAIRLRVSNRTVEISN